MTTIPKALQTALKHHQSGNYQQAESIYRQILEVDPAHVDALHLMGLIAHQVGKNDVAADYMRRAIRRKPSFPDAHNNLGNVLKALGKVEEATASYREALRLKPNYPEAHNNLGNVYKEQGQLDRAVACYQKALQLKPNYPDAYNNLGIVRMEMGELDKAISCYQKAIRRRPQFPEAYNNLGNAFKMQGKPNEAVAAFQQALHLRPAFPEALSSLGNALMDLERADDAIAAYKEALRNKPDFAEAYNNLGIGYMRQNKVDDAITAYREAIRLKADYAEAYNNLAIALAERGERAEAEAAYRLALRLRPNYAEAYNNLGNTLKDLDRLPEAETCYHEALRLKPDYADAYSNLGIACMDQGKLDEADGAYRKAIGLRPDYADAHRNRSFTLLIRGDFADGWPEYEWRWQCKEFGTLNYKQPRWDGAALDGKTILLHAEQGLGDTLQFIRYARLVKERGGRVLFGCQKPLVKLLSSTPGVDQIVAQNTELPSFDTYIQLMSLPAIFKTTEKTIPAEVPYILPDAGLLEKWRQEFSQRPTFKVGVVWQGNKDYKGDKWRSIPLKQFTTLAQVQGVEFFSLQKGYGSEQLDGVKGEMPITDLGPRLDVETAPFMDTAAVMKNLDLLITSDTSVVHLAGALGVPIWVALPFLPDWRWLLNREDNPWYPTMRLFRQNQRGNWPEVFERIAHALQEKVSMSTTVQERTSTPATTPASKAQAVAVEVAPGELIDKITILQIKSERISDPAKLVNVRHELNVLETVEHERIASSERLKQLSADLKAVNEALWDIEDEIRVCERAKDFGPRFIELARSVYHQNDRRAALKRQINDLLGSAIIEEKSYASYA
jgi:tetratricopeptide (TPR) repeat protein